MLTGCQVQHRSSKNNLHHCGTLSSRRRQHHMQQEDIEQKDDAATRASKSNDKSMNDKRDQAQHMAEELIAEEGRANPRSALVTYLIAAVIGLIIWAAIYYLWLST